MKILASSHSPASRKDFSSVAQRYVQPEFRIFTLKRKEVRYAMTAVAVMFFSTGLFAHEGDTLKCNFETGTPKLYVSGNGGYMFGTSGYADIEFAQKYGVGSDITPCTAKDSSALSEIMVWFGAKIAGDSDSVQVNVYRSNPATGAPGNLLSTSFPLSLDFINASSATMVLTRFLLQTPVTLTDSFFVSVVLPQTAGDTLGIMSTTDGDGGGLKLAWLKDSTGNWVSVQNARSLDISLAVFPVVVDKHDGGFTPVAPLDIPSAFTPNGDGFNDAWVLKEIENDPNVQVEIFNRWGALLFNSKGYSEPWDGTYKGKALPSAAYYYVITVNNDTSFTGTVTIVK